MSSYSSFTPTGNVSPFTVPEEQTGWRRMSVPGNFKRKVFTMYWNEQFMVQANLSWGEKGVRHTHASGELTISFADALHPQLHYNPPGVWHGGSAEGGRAESDLSLLEKLPKADPALIDFIKQLVEQQQALRKQVQALQRPPGPHIDLDILFPPFQTTIDDPNYPGSPNTITGPWED